MRISDWRSDVCSSDLRIIAEAGIAKATFYRHFKSKDDLVVAYLQREYGRQREAQESVPGAGYATITTIFDTLRSEERRVGKDCGRTGSFGWSPAPYKKTTTVN